MNRFLTALLASVLTLGLVLPGSYARADDPAPPSDTADTPTVVLDDESDDEGAGDETSDATSAAPQDDGPSLSVDINGSLRFNALFRSYGTSFERGNDRVLGDEPIHPDGEHGLVDLEAIEAIHDAADRGERVEL
ncbi:MAG: hypothetical protein ABEL51_08325 [Salinibacter sp.]